MSKQQDERGVVSFITVIFVSILLVIMTTAFIRLMVNEQRQATDNDLSNRAFYAAEAGIDDAISKIRELLEDNKPLTKQNLGNAVNDCGDTDVPKTLKEEASISYTCQLIDVNVNQIEGQLAEGEILTLDLINVSQLERLRVEWHIPGLDSVSDTGTVFTNVDRLEAGENLSKNGSKTSGNTWKAANIPAIMRLQRIAYNDSFASSAGIQSDITFGYPVILGQGSYGGVTLNTQTQTKGPSISNCRRISNSNGTEYACQLDFTNLGGENNKFLRLQAVNNKTHYLVKGFDATGNTPVDLPEQVAIIDVTGKAGKDVFRRVRVQVPLVPGAGLTPNQALLVDEQICKDLEVKGADGSKFIESLCPSPI